MAIFVEIVIVHRRGNSLAQHTHASLSVNGLSIGTSNSEAIAIRILRCYAQCSLITYHLVHLVTPLIGVRLIATCHHSSDCCGFTGTDCSGDLVESCCERLDVTQSGELLGLNHVAGHAQCAHYHEVGLVGSSGS